MNFRVARDAPHILTPIDAMAVYRWGSMTGEDYFCQKCGIMPFRKPGALTASERAAGQSEFDGWAINVRCLEGVDLATLPRRRIEGSKLRMSAMGRKRLFVGLTRNRRLGPL